MANLSKSNSCNFNCTSKMVTSLTSQGEELAQDKYEALLKSVGGFSQQ